MTDPDTVRGYASACDSTVLDRLDAVAQNVRDVEQLVHRALEGIADIRSQKEPPDWFLRHYFRGDAAAVAEPAVAVSLPPLVVFYNGNPANFHPDWGDRPISIAQLGARLAVPDGETLFQLVPADLEAAVAASATELPIAGEITLEDGMRFFSQRV